MCDYVLQNIYIYTHIYIPIHGWSQYIIKEYLRPPQLIDADEDIAHIVLTACLTTQASSSCIYVVIIIFPLPGMLCTDNVSVQVLGINPM